VNTFVNQSKENQVQSLYHNQDQRRPHGGARTSDGELATQQSSHAQVHGHIQRNLEPMVIALNPDESRELNNIQERQNSMQTTNKDFLKSLKSIKPKISCF